MSLLLNYVKALSNICTISARMPKMFSSVSDVDKFYQTGRPQFITGIKIAVDNCLEIVNIKYAESFFDVMSLVIIILQT